MRFRLLCLVCCIWSSCANAQVAHLIMHSERGDRIGQGQDWDLTYTPENSYWFSAQVRIALPTGEPAALFFTFGTATWPSTNVTLMFGTDQLGIPMQPGFYAEAERAPFATPGHPGLDVGMEGRGGDVKGNFTVTQFEYSPSVGIQSFSASFEQHSEGLPPALFGTFTYQAVPEPTTMGLLLVGSVGVLGGCRRRRINRIKV